MNKLIIFLLIVFVLVSGCNNVSEDFCTLLKHTPEINASIYMDNGFCIIEKENFNTTMIGICRSKLRTYYIQFILKSDGYNEIPLAELESEKGCKIEILD
jgi:hypothetical protein